MSNEWEQYRDRYEPERLETYEAYVDVWNRDADAERKYTDWITFAQCADANMTMVRTMPELVRHAETLMSRNGYRLSTGSGRRWQHTKGGVRSSYSTPGRTAPAAAKPRAAAKKATPRVPAPKKPVAAPKPPPRPTHVECPNDPGMMVPLTGSCMCGWSPSDP
jgi:hypothetical protein